MRRGSRLQRVMSANVGNVHGYDADERHYSKKARRGGAENEELFGVKVRVDASQEEIFPFGQNETKQEE